MLVTLSGILMLVSVSQQLNAKSPMLVTLSGILYVLSFALYVIIIVLSALNKIWFSYIEYYPPDKVVLVEAVRYYQRGNGRY